MPRRRPPMETFSFRASADVMAAARRTAKKRDEYLSDAIRDFVTRYARDEIRAARQSTPTALHHINGNPYDNRPENLQVVDVETHARHATPDTEET